MVKADRSKELSRRMTHLVNKALNERNLSARAVSIDVVGHDGLIRDIRAGRIPSYDRVRALLDYLGIDLYLGSDGTETNHLEYVPGAYLPLHGLAKCSLNGWADDKVMREDLPRPTWIEDDSAFWVSAAGQSMEPEGIRASDFCVVSPGRIARVGDRVWVKEASSDARVAIKRLIEMTADAIVLRGWQPPQDGKVSDFVETRPLTSIAGLHPVVAVYRGRLGKAGVDVQYIPDPRAEREARHDGIVIVERMDGKTGKAPSALGFPGDWIRRQGWRSDALALVSIDDDYFEPAIGKGSVVMLDTSANQVTNKDLYGIRMNGRLLVRRAEQLSNGSLLLSGDNPVAETAILGADKRDSAEIAGRVVWVSETRPRYQP